MKVIFKVKSVYGSDLNYPVNEAARAFCKIAVKKTLNAFELNLIKFLGHELEVQ